MQVSDHIEAADTDEAATAASSWSSLVKSGGMPKQGQAHPPLAR